jgi:hypothetical protein
MKLFEMKDWKLYISEEVWGLVPFNKILKRDKTKEKEIAFKEVLFIYYFCDIRSDYLTMEEDVRLVEIKHDIGLPVGWSIDYIVQEAMDIYMKHDSVLETLYRQTLKATSAVGKYLENAEALLAERDRYDKPTNDISKITTAIQKVPKLMSDLKSAYKEVVKEKEDTDNKKKGSKAFNTFEDGLTFKDE